uniref:Uncharacterized protein n=1 Tax=Anguilla anguilla TaxID=7936 RepID=A0A0E9U2H9_ANGAN
MHSSKLIRAHISKILLKCMSA